MASPLKALVLGITICAAALPAGALAQNADQEQPGHAAQKTDGRVLVDANSLKGTAVKDADGKNVARLEQIMIDAADGRVAYAVLGFGGTLGVGNTLVAVPWSGLKLAQDQKILVLNMDRSLLEKAPRVGRGQPQNPGQKQ